MVHREVTQRGWLSRLGGSFKGLLVGGGLLVLALGLQFWNEGRTVRRDAALAEGRADVVAVRPAPLDPAREGRLVHVSGQGRADRPVTDPAFAVSVPALALRRKVEMYQWEENKSTSTRRTSGGGEETTTTYSYDQDWDDDLIDSSDFRESGHDNPEQMPFRGEQWRASPIRLGDFVLSEAAAEELDGWQRVDLAKTELPPNLAASFRLDDGWFVTSENPASPQVGDVRVRFDYIPEGPLSVVARQQAGTLATHATSRGAELLLVESGTRDAAAMFDAAGSRNATAAWLLRLAGFVLAWIALRILLKPLVVMADVLPFAARIVGAGTGLASLLLALVLSVLAIGSGWLWYRPWLLAILIGVVVAGLVWLFRGTREPVAAPPPPPPPPPPVAS
jgi:hypothetical protein